MFKKAIAFTLVLSVLLSLSGCWSYRGLNEVSIVSGLGVDLNPVTGDYQMTFEVIDLASDTEKGGLKAKIVESTGKTIFDAARNAKKRVMHKLYFGNADILLIGNEVAKQEGLWAMLDWFIRDAELRETVSVIISQEKTAKEILSIEGIDSGIISREINKITDANQEVTASLRRIEVYDVFNILKGKGVSLVLPAFHLTQNDEKPVVEANGLAIFKHDKMIGYLDSIEAKYFLFATDEVKGGLITLSTQDDDKQDISLEISQNKTKTSFSYKDGKIKVIIKINTEVFLAEYGAKADFSDKQVILQVKEKAEKLLTEKVTAVIEKMQTQYHSDIFGFGRMVYRRDVKLWRKIEKDWDNLFKNLDVEVQAKVAIANTAFIKKN